jgi:hypothetical protein
MHAMHVLEQQYGWEVLRQKRILLIHAGGYSQRTPTTSCLGKIATSIPKGVIRIIYLMRIEKKKPNHDDSNEINRMKIK